MRQWSVYFLLAVALVMVVLLAQRTRQVRGDYHDLLDRATINVPGQFVPTFAAATLEGDSVVVGTTGPQKRQVLFFFNTTCPYCLRTIPAWKEIARVAYQSGHDVYGVALDSLPLVQSQDSL